MKKINLKKSIVLVLMVALMLTVVACGENEENSIKNQNNSNSEMSEENKMNNENVEQQVDEEEPEEVEEESMNGSSNSDTLNGITYSIISSRVLEANEFEVTDDGYKAILVDMFIENKSNEILNISTAMYFELIGESGEEYSVEYFVGATKGNLDSAVAPGKVLRGEFIFQTMEEDQKFALEIMQDFMSDDLAVVGFEENATYEVNIVESSKGGKTLGEEMAMENLSFVVTGASILLEGERTILQVDMTAKNNTGEMLSEYYVPFVLTNADGYVNGLDIKTDNYVLSDIPANGEKETTVYFKLIDPEMKSFDLYLSPFGLGAFDVLHLDVE